MDSKEFIQRVEKCKTEYLEEIKSLSAKYSNIVIYGAGNAGIPLLRYLRENGVDVCAFCVTNKADNKPEECGVPIYQVDELPFQRECTLILVALQEKYNAATEETLKKLQYSYILAPRYLYYFDAFRLDMITLPVVEVTTKMGCKINCRYCPQSLLISEYMKRSSHPEYLSFQDFKTCVDKLPENAIVEFAGYAEAFLNPQCTEMILYTYSTGRRMSLYTTLEGVTQEIYDKIKEIPFVNVILHLPDKDGYAKIQMNEEYFRILEQILANKRADGTDFVDWMNCQSEPDERVRKYIEGKGRVFTALYDRAGSLEGDSLMHKRIAYENIYCETALNLSHPVLLPNGELTLCTEDYGLKHVIGDLLEESYEDIMEGAEIQKIKKGMQEPESDILCRNCMHAVVCEKRERDEI